MKTQLVLTVILGGAMLTSGCATKKYVAKTVAPVEQRVSGTENKNTEQDKTIATQGTQIEGIDRDLSQTKEKLGDTDAKATQAGEAAKMADQRAGNAQQAADDFFPGYAQTFTQIGKERGWPPTTRAQFDATRGPTGALIIGDADTVTEKILYINEALGGIARITFQMGVSTLPHAKMMHAIEILGTRVAPMVREELSVSAGITK